MALGFADTLARALQEGLAGYQTFQTRIRPRLEEEAFLREQRGEAARERRRRHAEAQINFFHTLYGHPDAAFQALGDRYLRAVQEATGIELPTEEVPVLERVRARRQVGVRPSALGTGLQAIGAGQVPLPEGVALEEPEFEEVEEEQPTGRTTRRLAGLPRGEEPIVDVPMLGRIPASRARELLGQEGLARVLGIVDPIAMERLRLDMRKADFDEAARRAQLEWQQYQHANPSAFQQADLRLRQLAQAATDAHRQAQLALQQGQLDELRRWHDLSARLQAEANAIRRAAAAQGRQESAEAATMRAFLEGRPLNENQQRYIDNRLRGTAGDPEFTQALRIMQALRQRVTDQTASENERRTYDQAAAIVANRLGILPEVLSAPTQHPGWIERVRRAITGQPTPTQPAAAASPVVTRWATDHYTRLQQLSQQTGRSVLSLFNELRAQSQAEGDRRVPAAYWRELYRLITSGGTPGAPP